MHPELARFRVVSGEQREVAAAESLFPKIADSRIEHGQQARLGVAAQSRDHARAASIKGSPKQNASKVTRPTRLRPVPQSSIAAAARRPARVAWNVHIVVPISRCSKEVI